MKHFIFALSLFLGRFAFSCDYGTIDSIINPIDPYESSAGAQTSSALEALTLCDENLLYAGEKLANQFNPYETRATKNMIEAIVAQRNSLHHDFIQGLGLGLVKKINLYEFVSTSWMLHGILSVAEVAPEHAKAFALNLLKKQNANEKEANDLLLETVSDLRKLTATPQPDPIQSSVWAFRSNNATCDGVRGPWGYYEMCPRFYASVSDKYGNRIVLACKSENYGIDFRVSLARDSWSQISSTRIQSIAFGTRSTLQSLGTPYVVPQDRTLLSVEPVAMDVLNELRSANSLTIAVRANSGEVNKQFKFSLSGSNLAIGELLKFCR